MIFIMSQDGKFSSSPSPMLDRIRTGGVLFLDLSNIRLNKVNNPFSVGFRWACWCPGVCVNKNLFTMAIFIPAQRLLRWGSEMLKSVGHAGKTDKICSCPTKVTQIPVQMSDVFLKRRFRQMRQSIESWPLECFILPTLYYN